MIYGVIVCPKCKKVKGVDLSKKTTKCPRCRKILTIDKLKIFYKTTHREKLQNAIGLMNAKFDGRLNEFKEILQNKHWYGVKKLCNQKVTPIPTYRKRKIVTYINKVGIYWGKGLVRTCDERFPYLLIREFYANSRCELVHVCTGVK